MTATVHRHPSATTATGSHDPSAPPRSWTPQSALSPTEIQRIGKRSRDRKALEKSISPVDLTTVNIYSADVIDKSDPVLRLLALSDEKEYKRMIDSDTAIGGAVEQRISGVISAGSEIVPGPSRSDNARQLAKFAIRLLKHIPKLGTFRREALRSIQYGWSPIELQWKYDMDLGASPQWGIARAVVRKPWNYHITKDGYLVRGTHSGRDPEILDSPTDEMRYRIFTAGSTESPYGEAYLRRVWLLFFLSKKFERMSAQQMQRSLGLIKAKMGGGRGRNSQHKIDADLSRVLTMLNSYNILWEIGDSTLTFVDMPNVTKNTVALLDYFNTQKRIAIVGQNLSSEVRAGSFAATQTHVDDVLRSYIEADAREEQDWYNDQIIAPAIFLNFGEQDPMDMPRWRSKLFRPKLDLKATQTFYDMGGEVDARQFAEAGDIPAALPDDDSPQHLSNQGASGSGEADDSNPGGVRGPGRPRERKADGEGDRDRTRASANLKVQSAADNAPDLTDPHSVLRAHYTEIRDRFIEANPAPKDWSRRELL